VRNIKLLWQLYIPYLLITLASLVIFGGLAYWSIRSFYFNQTADVLTTRAGLVGREVGLPLAAGDTAAAIQCCRELAPLVQTG